jgi:competence protein ComFC
MGPAAALGTPPGLDECLALLSYEGAARELVARIKYRNHRAALGWLATGMAGLVDTVLRSEIDIVTWAPATPEHARRRGFDHGELLARRVARHLGRPSARLLRRANGPGLTGQAAAERRHAGVALECTVPVAGSRVVLVDDVVTTGTTMTTAAHALRAAGARIVVGLAAARTPPPDAGRGA